MEKDSKYHIDVPSREGKREALHQEDQIHSLVLVVNRYGSQVEEGSDNRADNGKKVSLAQDSTVDRFDSCMAEIQRHRRKDIVDSMQDHHCLYDKCYLHIAVHGWKWMISRPARTSWLNRCGLDQGEIQKKNNDQRLTIGAAQWLREVTFRF